MIAGADDVEEQRMNYYLELPVDEFTNIVPFI
jgi:hypothetical protein